MARGKKWIAEATAEHPGALRRQTHTKAGHKIPLSVLEKDAHAPGVLGKRARLALTLRGLRR